VIKIGKELVEAAEQLEREKGITKEVIIKSLCDAMVTAYKKHIRGHEIGTIIAQFDEKTGEIGVFRQKQVVESVEFEYTEVEYKEAKKIDPTCQLDDIIYVDATPADFGRIAAQAAKQVITQRIREAERKLILDEFMDKKGNLLTGIVQRRESRNVIVNIGRTEAILPGREQIPGEYYRTNDRIRVYVLDVKETTRLPQVIVSQVHPRIVQELFELEVPEIEDGVVEIVSISREAGYRTKIAVHSHDAEVDPVGACIGPRGSRIQTIVNELKNEKIDIVRYSDDPIEFISNALSPARIAFVEILEDSSVSKEALIVVPDDQLSLAIGKEGQNVRLAHRLTGWKIDIKSLSQIEAMENANQRENQEQEVADSSQEEGQEEEVTNSNQGEDQEEEVTNSNEEVQE